MWIGSAWIGLDAKPCVSSRLPLCHVTVSINLLMESDAMLISSQSRVSLIGQFVTAAVLLTLVCTLALVDAAEEGLPTETPADATPPAAAEPESPEAMIQRKAGEAIKTVEDQASKVAKSVDETQQAKVAAENVLKPIYMVAESLSFPAFYWIAFTLFAAGAISFALQLVLGKLVVLSRMGFSLKEILSDLLGLVISLLGLVLTTQAATENSTFTTSASAVLSATAVGGVLGFFMYLWGQSQEIEAARGRSMTSNQQPPAAPGK